MISWRWCGHVDDAAYAIVYSIAIIGFTLIFITFYISYTMHIRPLLLVFYCLSLSTSCCLLISIHHLYSYYPFVLVSLQGLSFLYPFYLWITMISLLLIVWITGLWLLYLYILTFYFSLLYFTSTLIFYRRVYTSLSWVYRWFSSSTYYPLIFYYYLSYMPLLRSLHHLSYSTHSLPTSYLTLLLLYSRGRVGGFIECLVRWFFIHFIFISFYLFTYY